MDFPIYRKYSTGKTFFRIRSITEFDEVNRIGNKYSLKSFTAQILPDRVFIYDMIAKTNNHWEEATEEEFDSFLSFCKSNLQSF